MNQRNRELLGQLPFFGSPSQNDISGPVPSLLACRKPRRKNNRDGRYYFLHAFCFQPTAAAHPATLCVAVRQFEPDCSRHHNAAGLASFFFELRIADMPVKRSSTDSRIAVLLQNLDCAFDKPAWHGPNFASSIRGVDARRAAQSIAGRRSNWQQVLHAAYWKQRVINLLIGTQPFPRKGSDWPLLPDEMNERTWKADVKLLHEIHATLQDAIAQLDPQRLDEKTTRLILGAAAHDLYHTGQIRLLRRMMRLARAR